MNRLLMPVMGAFLLTIAVLAAVTAYQAGKGTGYHDGYADGYKQGAADGQAVYAPAYSRAIKVIDGYKEMVDKLELQLAAAGR